MSIVIYDPKEERMYADSIIVNGSHRFEAQKIFTYTARFNKRNGEETEERGLAGFVGDIAFGYALIDAYTQGGAEGCEKFRRDLMSTVKNEDDTYSGDILIVPEHSAYMWLTSGLSRPLYPIPKQFLAIGHSQITSRLHMLVSNGQDIGSALNDCILHSSVRDSDGLVEFPVMTLSMSGKNDTCRFYTQDIVL